MLKNMGIYFQPQKYPGLDQWFSGKEIAVCVLLRWLYGYSNLLYGTLQKAGNGQDTDKIIS